MNPETGFDALRKALVLADVLPHQKPGPRPATRRGADRCSVNGLLTNIGQFAGEPDLQTGPQTMQMNPIPGNDQTSQFTAVSPGDSQTADIWVAQCLAEAADGDASACFDLGVVYSTGSHGVFSDLIEAHKWFNLAAVAGHACAKTCRADIAEEMTPREIAEAQRRAREWIAAGSHPAL